MSLLSLRGKALCHLGNNGPRLCHCRDNCLSGCGVHDGGNDWQAGIDQSEVSVCHMHSQLTAITHTHTHRERWERGRYTQPNPPASESKQLTPLNLAVRSEARQTDGSTERHREIKSVCPVKLEAIIVNSVSCFEQEHSVLSFYIRRVLFMELWKVSL